MLARVNRAPLGTLRAMHDNERERSLTKALSEREASEAELREELRLNVERTNELREQHETEPVRSAAAKGHGLDRPTVQQRRDVAVSIAQAACVLAAARQPGR